MDRSEDAYRLAFPGGGEPLPTPGPGTPAVGLKIDNRMRLFVAGGTAGDGRVVDARTGQILVNYQFVTGNAFINDVVLHDGAAYFTDSRSSALFVVPLGRNGSLPPPELSAFPGALILGLAEAASRNGDSGARPRRTVAARTAGSAAAPPRPSARSPRDALSAAGLAGAD